MARGERSFELASAPKLLASGSRPSKRFGRLGLRSALIGARGFRDDPEKLKLQLASTHHLHPADPGLQAGDRMSGQLARARAPASDVVSSSLLSESRLDS